MESRSLSGTIGIVDYGLGNLFSVLGAVEKLGRSGVVTSEREVLSKAEKLIIPGVGAFGAGINNLHKLGLVDTLTDLVMVQKKPVLGMCLGAQLMMSTSEEAPGTNGLGWLVGKVEKIQPQNAEIRTPHVGWNEVYEGNPGTLLRGIPDRTLFYFVHSYFMNPEEDRAITGYFNYGTRMCALIEYNHIFAAQFHPEKSQQCGLQLLENFLDYKF